MAQLLRSYRVCSDPKGIGCQLEAEPRKQRCYECWLAAQPPVVRTMAAERRASLVPDQHRRSTVPKEQWPEGRRWCAGCQTFVRLVDCTGSRCSACVSISSHKGRVKANFGIEPETYQWLLVAQHGKCAICRQAPKSKRMAIDHWHGCPECKGEGCPKCVRGLLCSRCNHELLAAAHDSIHILRNAVAYLETPPMQGEWPLPQLEVEQWREKYGSDPAPYGGSEVAPY